MNNKLKKILSSTLAVTLATATVFTTGIVTNATELTPVEKTENENGEVVVQSTDKSTEYTSIPEKVEEALPEVSAEPILNVNSIEDIDSKDTINETSDSVFKSCRLIVTNPTDLEFKEESLGTDNIVSVQKYEDKYFVTYRSVYATEKAYNDLTALGLDVELDVVQDTPERVDNKDVRDNEVGKEEIASTDEAKPTQPIEQINQSEEQNTIIVAILDTGLNDGEAIFDNKVVEGKNFIDETDTDVKDLDTHGTTMARIILSEVEDVNTENNIKIMPIKVLNDEGKGTTLSAYKGIKYVIEKKKANPNLDFVINLSMSGIGHSKLLESAINEAYNNNIPVVVSAGNDNKEITEYTPANIDSAFTITSADKNEDKIVKAVYSNYGSEADYTTSGHYEYIRNIDNKEVVTKVDGTSVSSAYVSSYIAMLKQMALSDDNEDNDNLSIADIDTSLSESAISVDVPLGKGYLAKENIQLKKVEEEEQEALPVEEISSEDLDEGIEIYDNVNSTTATTYNDFKWFYSVMGWHWRVITTTTYNGWFYEAYDCPATPVDINFAQAIFKAFLESGENEAIYLNGGINTNGLGTTYVNGNKRLYMAFNPDNPGSPLGWICNDNNNPMVQVNGGANFEIDGGHLNNKGNGSTCINYGTLKMNNSYIAQHMSWANGDAFINHGTATISDTRICTDGGFTNGNVVTNRGTLILNNGGTVWGAGRSGINNYNGAVSVDGGLVKNDLGDAITNWGNGTITCNGTLIEANSGKLDWCNDRNIGTTGITTADNSNTYLNNCTVSASHVGIRCCNYTGGRMSATGGTISGNNFGVRQEAGRNVSLTNTNITTGNKNSGHACVVNIGAQPITLTSCNLYNSERGIWTIYGTTTSTSHIANTTYGIYNQSNTNVNAGSYIYSNTNGIYNAGGTTTINGGYITANPTGIQNSATLNLKGGSINNNGTTNPTNWGWGIENYGTVNHSAGSVYSNGKNKPSGDSVNSGIYQAGTYNVGAGANIDSLTNSVYLTSGKVLNVSSAFNSDNTSSIKLTTATDDRKVGRKLVTGSQSLLNGYNSEHTSGRFLLAFANPTNDSYDSDNDFEGIAYTAAVRTANGTNITSGNMCLSAKYAVSYNGKSDYSNNIISYNPDRNAFYWKEQVNEVGLADTSKVVKVTSWEPYEETDLSAEGTGEYEFVGWCEDREGKNTIYTEIRQEWLDRNKPYYAIYRRGKAKVTYNPNGAVDKNGKAYEPFKEDEQTKLREDYTPKDGSIFGEKQTKDGYIERQQQVNDYVTNHIYYITNKGEVVNTKGSDTDMYSFQGWSVIDYVTSSKAEEIIYNGLTKFYNLYFDETAALNLGYTRQPIGVALGTIVGKIVKHRNDNINALNNRQLGDLNKILEATGIVDVYAVWDKYPTIETRTFNISSKDAENLTDELLLDKIKVTDEEDGTISKDKIKLIYDKDQINGLAEQGTCYTSITVVAEDSVGNVTKKVIMIGVNQVNPLSRNEQGFIRFISREAFEKSEADGGPLENSIWRTDEEYRKTMLENFDNLENNTPEQRWNFTHEQVLEVQDYIKDNGFGKSKSNESLENFYNKFAGEGCLTENRKDV